MDNNISSGNTSVQSSSAMPLTNVPPKAKNNADISVMFYLMKSMQETINGDIKCLQTQTREEAEKEAIIRVLETIEGLSNRKAFLKSVIQSLGLSDIGLKSFVNGLLEGTEQLIAEEAKIKAEEKQYQDKMDADNDLTKMFGYKDKYELTPDLKEEWKDFTSTSSRLDRATAIWNLVDGHTERELMEWVVCKYVEFQLTLPGNKKLAGVLLNNSIIKSVLGLNNDKGNSKIDILSAVQYLAGLTGIPFLGSLAETGNDYSKQINKWLDTTETWIGKQINDLAEKLTKDSSKGQAWYKYVFEVPAEFTGLVVASLGNMIFSFDAKAFHLASGDYDFTISKDQTSLDTWKKQVDAYEMNADNLSNLIVQDESNKSEIVLQLNNKGLKDLEQSTKSLDNFGVMLNQLVQSNSKV